MDIEAARQQMIEQQVRAWAVLEPRVLDALGSVRRECFVPEPFRQLAFADTAIPLPCGQSMLPPKLEGRILQALDVQPGESVLEIGTGSGFFAACLGALARSVRSIEFYPDFVATARASLARVGVHNVAVEVLDAMTLAEDGAYDVIALTGSLPVYDARFERALSVRGRLFAVVGPGPVMEAQRITRTRPDEWLRESLFETSIEPLVHAPRPPRFVF